MVESLMKLVSLCWSPQEATRISGERGDSVVGGEGRDGLLWDRDLGRLGPGLEFSMAVVQANQVLEDQSRVESGPLGTYVGIFDGHGGPQAARYACDYLHRNLHDISSGSEGMTLDGIRRAFLETEEGFTERVSKMWDSRPEMATNGTCCLVGVVSEHTLYVASLGDSRAVLGRKFGCTGDIAAIQLSAEHNANFEAVRQELRAEHPEDPEVVVLKHGVWRVKGIIQVSRSIGDVYLKHAQFNREPISMKFRISEPMNMPYLSANPSIISHHLQPSDSFVIFASDGLWEHLSNEQAVEIVHNHPHAGSARKLIIAALHEAARKREMRYSDLSRIDKKVRRHFHDDITVVVLFVSHDQLSQGHTQGIPLSVRSALEH